MDPRWCGPCRDDKARKNWKPSPPVSSSRKKQEGKYDRIYQEGYIVINSKKGDSSHDDLNETVKIVHVKGNLSFELMKIIFDNAPNAREIELTPSKRKEVPMDVISICRNRGVVISVGHSRHKIQR